MGDYLLPLSEAAQVTLDASGNGLVFLGPNNAAQVWKPSSAACRVSSNIKEPQFYLYNGRTTDPSRQIGGTWTGSNDSTDLNGIVLYPGSVLTGQWLGGDVGATGTLSLVGDVERYP